MDVNDSIPANMQSGPNTLSTGQGALISLEGEALGANGVTPITVAARTSAYLNALTITGGAYGANSSANFTALVNKVETICAMLKTMGVLKGTN